MAGILEKIRGWFRQKRTSEMEHFFNAGKSQKPRKKKENKTSAEMCEFQITPTILS